VEPAPDLVRAVIGFRQWRLHDGLLWSLYTGDLWDRATRTARCLRDGAHEGPAPGHTCSCGFYAWYGPAARTASAATPDLVGGAVALWGRLELHAHGMRAEHARMVALALPVSWGRKRRRLVSVGEELGVPLVPARRLKRVALEHGDVIPRRMRPPDLAPNKRAAPGPPAPARLNAVADGLRQKGGA
jgi:hypothetical protein